MNHFLCNNRISISLKTSLHLCNKSHFSFPFSVFFFSSQPPNSESVSIADYLIGRHGFSPETALKASAVITHIKNPEKSDSILAFLKQSGFSKTHLEKIVKQGPWILSSNLDKCIKSKIKLFQELGFNQNDLIKIITSDPWILRRSAEKRLIPSIVMLKNVLGSSTSVSKVLKLCGWLITRDLNKTMIPNIEFMTSRGISRSQITNLVSVFPRFFVIKPDRIKSYVQKVEELGLNGDSKMFLYAIRSLSSMTKEKWELKLNLFRSLGFSEDEILLMFRKAPNVFNASEEKIRGVLNFVFSTEQCGASFIALHPQLLLYSLEGRMKPRVRILEVLKRKNLIRTRSSLISICWLTHKEFFQKYVSPYEKEVGSLYIAKKS